MRWINRAPTLDELFEVVAA
jgi:hypothetical protein